MNIEQQQEQQRAIMISTIGLSTILAVSGGRIKEPAPLKIALPVSSGYSVEVLYEPVPDLYRVERVFTRAGKRFVKGSVRGIYSEDLSERVWEASCFSNIDFGKVEQ